MTVALALQAVIIKTIFEIDKTKLIITLNINIASIWTVERERESILKCGHFLPGKKLYQNVFVE